MSTSVEIKNVDLLRETEKAIQIDYCGSKYWIPTSQIKKLTRSPKPAESSIVMSQWIAKLKDLI